MIPSAAAFFCLCIVAVYSTGPQEMKRQGLIPFPRVGRGGSRDNYGGKRDVVQGNGGGMWFGPRLGRLQKREVDNTAGWALIQIRGDFPLSRGRPTKENFKPRLGRESSEELFPGYRADGTEN